MDVSPNSSAARFKQRKWRQGQAAGIRRGVPVALVWCLSQFLNSSGVYGQTLNSPADKPATMVSQELPFTRLNTWSAFVEYSPNSSHLILGFAEQRRLVTLGGEYSRRISLRKWEALYYVAQVRPIVLEGDPLLVALKSVSTNQIVTRFSDPLRVLAINHGLVPMPEGKRIVFLSPVYGREWTYSGGLNPLGLKLNLDRFRSYADYLFLRQHYSPWVLARQE